MKKNVRIMLKIAIISMILAFAVAAKSFADVNMNSIDFTNIPESGTNNTSNTTNNSTNNSASTNTTNSTTNNTTNTTNNTTSTSSSSNTKMPATGSNLEIVFGVMAVVIVSGAIFLYRKQNVKLK